MYYFEEIFFVVFFKVFLIFVLIGFVRLNVGDEDIIYNLIFKSDFYKFMILGLLFFSIGDVCFIVREIMFIFGMLFFFIV